MSLGAFLYYKIFAFVAHCGLRLKAILPLQFPKYRVTDMSHGRTGGSLVETQQLIHRQSWSTAIMASTILK